MCIIVVCEEKKPDRAFMERCAKENPHGIGISWREKSVKTGKMIVRFAKGVDINVDALMELIDRIELPFVIHFRIKSVGQINSELCHPFPLGGDLRLQGGTYRGVLFHNGTWKEWGTWLSTLTQVPGGLWSDSRALAYIANFKGLDWLQTPAQYNRICVMTSTHIMRFGKWFKEDGFSLSHTMRTPYVDPAWRLAKACGAIDVNDPEPDEDDENEEGIDDLPEIEDTELRNWFRDRIGHTARADQKIEELM